VIGDRITIYAKGLRCELTCVPAWKVSDDLKIYDFDIRVFE